MLRRVIVYTAFAARLRRAARLPAVLLERALLPWRTAFAIIEDEERLGELRTRASGWENSGRGRAASSTDAVSPP
jgi:hypothetical protein